MKKYLAAIARILLGATLLFAGLNKIFWFVPIPPMAPAAASLMSAFKAGGYFVPLLGVVEIIGGVLFLLNRLLPFALLITAPVVVNILAWHVFLDRRALPIALTLVLLESYLAWQDREAFRGIFIVRGPRVSQ